MTNKLLTKNINTHALVPRITQALPGLKIYLNVKQSNKSQLNKQQCHSHSAHWKLSQKLLFKKRREWRMHASLEFSLQYVYFLFSSEFQLFRGSLPFSPAFDLLFAL